FKAFGAKVPQEISAILKMDRKINVQKQLEKKAPIFLLSESPGDVAKHLNDVSNLGGIDTAIDAGKVDLKHSQRNKKVTDTQINAKTIELKKYTRLAEFKKVVIHAEKMERRIRILESTITSLTIDLEEIDETRKKIKKTKKKLTIRPVVSKAHGLLLTSLELKSELNSLQVQFIDIRDARKQVKSIEEQLKIKPYVKRCMALVQIKAGYQTTIDFYGDSLAQIKKTKQSIVETEKARKSAKKAYDKMMPDICPFCKSEVKND
ncbi:MAG: hypothetical protein PF503_18800, partial [Desulfobacula sp.]|nr:hypothetical protein [Desulfobacula sp.]